MQSRTQTLLAVLCLTAAATAARAQAPAILNPIRTSRSIGPAETQQIAAWLDAQLQTAGNRPEEMQKFVTAAVPLLDDSASAEFRDTFAEQAGQKFTQAQSGQTPAIVRSLCIVLASTRSAKAVPFLLLHVGSEDTATRYVAVSGVRRVLGEMPAESRTEALARFREVVQRESNPLVRAELCEAIGQFADPAAAMQLFGELLTARAASLRRGGLNELHDLKDVVVIVDRLSALRGGQLAPPQKQPAVVAVANILQYVVTRFEDADTLSSEAKEQLALTIARSDAALAALLGARGGNLTEALAGDESEVVGKLQEQLKLWIGDTATEGALNRDPWNLPRGGGFPEITH